LKNRYEHAAERDALKRDLERLRTVPSLLLTRPEAVRCEQVGHAVRSCIEALLARKPSALRARTLFSMDGEVASGTLSIRLIDLIIDNLLDNALTHGRQDQPVTIGVHIDNGNLAIEVSSKGTFPPSVLQGTARGIGLRVATRAAERAKGSLILHNDDDRAVATYTQRLGATGSE
jgi:anti-sigma regulatory factor (Ser/Thr protein kinase)